MIHAMKTANDTRRPSTDVLTAARVKPGAAADNTRVTDALARLLADTFRLILKTQNFHWNVTGPNFIALHELFEQQYTELREALDEIAERMRALGVRAPASFEEYERLSSIQDAIEPLAADDMCLALAEDHRRVSESAAHVVEAADDIGDEGTADLATARVRVSDKAAWILGAHVA